MERDRVQPLEPLDLMVVLKMAVGARSKDRCSVRELAASLAVPKSNVQRSMDRLVGHALVVVGPDGRRLNRLNARELFSHGVRWIAPAKPGKIVLGLPTAYAASPLASQLPGDADPVVIPLEEGPVRGRSVTPIHPSAPAAARKDHKLHELLAIVDGIRIGGAREREVAIAALKARL
ncbi:MAG TPA: helix-turn-helix domain-containing protein [Polyangia bacterium]|nr:helix-turn-helix domain-containing protein [Polyangia bacterium]